MSREFATVKSCQQAVAGLLDYCRRQNWEGYDPYDGLSAPVAALLPVRHKLPRTAIIQLVKRSPLNLRPLLGIKKGLNPKGLALAARALALLIERGSPQPARDLQRDYDHLTDKLISLKSPGYEDACWGYNFDWQSRAFFAPRGTPNAVCTTFAGHALFDRYERTGSGEAFGMAESACRFLLGSLNRKYDSSGHCFSYTPLDSSSVHNVNMLVAELLARAHALTGSDRYREAARKAVEYTLGRQSGDGSWPYGEAGSQGWIDSFHTGFIIVSLKRARDCLGIEAWSEPLARAYRFYEERFFLADSTPKYYHDRVYPIDVHSAAQAIITFGEMIATMPTAKKMSDGSTEWALKNLLDPSGYFYFQKHRFYTVKTSFMRWSQTWMLYALSHYLSRNTVGGNV